jgi:cysteine/O-acetylserine efflux protein
MNIDIMPLVVFVLVTTFTPGPGNIASAAMGMSYGYRRTTRFLSGIVTGYFLVMMLCAFLSSSILKIIPTAEPALRLLGSGYILWLAYGTARMSYNFAQDDKSPMLFKHGFLLQALNPKAIVFGITMYSTFLSNIAGKPLLLSVSTVLLAAVTFCSVSFWALGGVTIGSYLHLPNIRKGVNLFLVVLLVYCAATLSGLFSVS